MPYSSQKTFWIDHQDVSNRTNHVDIRIHINWVLELHIMWYQRDGSITASVELLENCSSV